MTTFEYLAVLISIIVGLGITHLLGGVARFISNPSKYKLYWVHLAWIAFLFLYLVMFWWAQLWMNSVEEWTYLLYWFLVLHAVLLFLLSAVIIPSDFPEDGDFRNYFYERRRWFFGIYLAESFVYAWDMTMKGQEIHPATVVVISALLVTGIVTKNAKYHGVLVLLNILLALLGIFSGVWDRYLFG